MYRHAHSYTHTHTHLWWSVARCPSGVVPVELPQHRVAGLHLGHIQGRVVVRELKIDVKTNKMAMWENRLKFTHCISYALHIC